MRPYRPGLTLAIFASLAALLVLTWLFLSLTAFKTTQKDLYEQKAEHARLLLASFIELCPGDGSVGTGAEQFAHRLARERDFAGLLVVDSAGRELYRLEDSQPPDQRLQETIARGRENGGLLAGGRSLARYAPLAGPGGVVGAARLTYSLEREIDRLGTSQRLFFAYFVLDSLLLLGFGAFLLSRLIVVPVRRLLNATERIAAGDFLQKVHVAGAAELAELADAFNGMAAALEAKRLEVEQTLRSLEEANRQLNTAREESLRSEKLASTGMLSAGMAHEIGTPLAAILGYASLLEQGLPDRPELADCARRLGESAARIDRIVRGLLDFARPAPPARELFSPLTLVEETLSLLQEQGFLKQVRVACIPRGEIPAVFLDRHQLQQVLINLCINARDAMPDGGELRIAIEAAGAGETPGVLITVADSGSGIPADQLGRIFDPFFTTKEPGKGTGLGLAISARIIEACGGRITVESEIGRGTAVMLWLPAQLPAGGAA